MSVPEHRRQENKFEVLNQTRDLAAYTAHILSNENVFDRKYQWLINKTNNLATDIFLECFHANGLNLANEHEAEERKQLQRDAVQKCRDLTAMIGLSKSVFHLRAKRIQYWGEKAISCRKLIQAWIESDRKRK